LGVVVWWLDGKIQPVNGSQQVKGVWGWMGTIMVILIIILIMVQATIMDNLQWIMVNWVCREQAWLFRVLFFRSCSGLGKNRR